MKEMADLKAKLKDQNARLLQVAQEKAKMEAKNKTRQAQVKMKFEKPNPILSYILIFWQGSRKIPSTRKAEAYKLRIWILLSPVSKTFYILTDWGRGGKRISD